MLASGVDRPHIFRIEIDREEDGRWIADIEAIPGALAYGRSREEAIAKAEALARNVIAGQTETNVTSRANIPEC